MILRVLKKSTDQQQANIEKTVERLLTVNIEKTIERLLKKALAKEKNVHQNTTESENDVTPPIATEPTREPVIEAVIESETRKQTSEKSRPSQDMTPPLPCNVATTSSQTATTSSQTASNAHDDLCFPPKLSQDQRYDAKKLLQRTDGDNAQILLDMLTKRMRNTSNPVNSPIAYLTNLLSLLENDALDIPMSLAAPSAIPATMGSIAAAEPRPLRESERRQAEYQEAVADCIQMEQNVKLLARKDSLTFEECLDQCDLRGLWRSIRDRFTETKEALAAIQGVNAVSV